jgi:hypothetical protein
VIFPDKGKQQLLPLICQKILLLSMNALELLKQSGSGGESGARKADGFYGLSE